MGNIKVRKIGNSIGIMLPKKSGLEVGDLLEYTHDGKKLLLDTENVGKEYDKKLMEDSFADFVTGNVYNEKDVKKYLGNMIGVLLMYSLVYSTSFVKSLEEMIYT